MNLQGRARVRARLAVASILLAVATAGTDAQRRSSAVPARPDDKTIVHVLNRIGFGPAPGDVARVRAMAAMVPASRPQSVTSRVPASAKASAVPKAPAAATAILPWRPCGRRRSAGPLGRPGASAGARR